MGKYTILSETDKFARASEGKTPHLAKSGAAKMSHTGVVVFVLDRLPPPRNILESRDLDADKSRVFCASVVLCETPIDKVDL